MLRNAATAVICLLCLAACSQGHGPEAIPQETVERLNTVFAQAARLSRGLAVEAWGVFASPPEPLASESPQAQRYAFFENVAYRKIARDGGVAVWASGATRVTPLLTGRMAALERVCGRSIKEAVTRHLFIDQAYVLTTSSVAVYYPPAEAAALLPLRMDFNTAIRPVYMAGPQTNPVRGTIWLPPYVDATGKGYVTSVCTPVYSGERYVASAGCDLRTRPLGESLLDPSRAALLLLDERRTVVHATPPARRRYGISCLDDVYYLDTVREDVLAPSEYQLDRQSSPTAAALSRVLPDDDRRFSFSLLGAPCPAEVRTLENGWRLVGLLPPELP